MNAIDYPDLLRLSVPEAILTLAAVLVLFLDLGGMRGLERPTRRALAAGLVGLGCVVAGFWLVLGNPLGAAPGGMLVMDPLARLAKLALLGLALLTALVAVDADFTEHIGEFFALLLLGTIGLLLLVSAENLLMIFVALELASLSLYLMVAFNRRQPNSAEAALKYFLFGGAAAAFTLYGFSLIYGLAGTIELRGVAAAVRGRGLDPVLALALVLTLSGLGFKVAAVPFHFWAPDAYQGAPTPAAAWIASGSKVASFVLLAKVMMVGFSGAEGSAAWGQALPGWVPLVSLVAGASLVVGNLVAIVQSSVKRLLAYSAIAHAGYTLVGVAADSVPGVVAVVYYAVTYALAALGAFAIVGMVEDASGDARLERFAGLAKRSPVLALCLMVFVLSLAGIPPLAGFFGKFYLFAAALHQAKPVGLVWLVALAVAGSAVSLYYYLQVLKQAYVAPPQEATPLRVGAAAWVAVLVLAALVVLLGIVPNLLVGRLVAAVGAAGW